MTASPSNSSAWVSHVERIVVFFVIAFLAQVTVGGHSLNVTDSTGQAAAVSGILSAIYVALRSAVAGG